MSDRAPQSPDAVRRRLNLGAADLIGVIPPPITLESGAYFAVWAGLLCYEVRREIRLIVPEEPRSGPNLRHMARSTRHEQAIRFAPTGVSLPELLRTAQAAVFVPTGDQPLDGLLEAVGSGVATIVSRLPALAALLRDGEDVWLVPPGDARATARALLDAFERPEEAARRAANARRRIDSLQGTNATNF